jgi:nicotinamide mononucleotide transporter
MSGAEIVGTLTAFASVVLTLRARVASWPVGIVSCVAFLVLFYDIKLYADAGLQVFFIITGFWGWRVWLKGGEGLSPAPVGILLARDRIRVLALAMVSIVLCGWLFQSYTDAHIPYWDSAIAGLSVTAQVLLARKKLENWLVWIVVDVLSIGVYFYKKIYLTSLLYVFFLVLATRGYFEWRNILKSQNRMPEALPSSSSPVFPTG